MYIHVANKGKGILSPTDTIIDRSKGTNLHQYRLQKAGRVLVAPTSQNWF